MSGPQITQMTQILMLLLMFYLFHDSTFSYPSEHLFQSVFFLGHIEAQP